MRLQPLHRARRLAAALRPSAPDPADERWAEGWLSPSERPLFAAMAPEDRAHAIAVARAVAAEVETAGVGAADGEWIMAAALLHDVGKSESDLGVPGRVAATVLAWAGGSGLAGRWAASPGRRGRIGRYMRYPEIGADLLRNADSDPRVVAWATQHHAPESRWTVPADVGRILVRADDAGAA